jgi:hypothetical protein
MHKNTLKSLKPQNRDGVLLMERGVINRVFLLWKNIRIYKYIKDYLLLKDFAFFKIISKFPSGDNFFSLDIFVFNY